MHDTYGHWESASKITIIVLYIINSVQLLLKTTVKYKKYLCSILKI
jgi:hypothetical protein